MCLCVFITVLDLQNLIISYILKEFDFDGETFLCEPTESHVVRKNTVIMRRRETMPKETCPGLLQWDLYLKLLANAQQQQSSPPPSEEKMANYWLEIFSGRKEFFFEFFTEWINYVRKYLSDE